MIFPMRLAAAFLTLSLQCAAAHAAFQALRIADPAYVVKMDGALSDPMWRRAPVFDGFYEHTPEEKVPAKIRTEIRIMYDARHLYVGMKAWDPDPSAIRAPYSRRDKTLGDQDLLILFLDPNGSRKAAQFVRVNARGSVSDGIYTDQNGEDFAPDFDFTAATGRFEGGWTAEIRIPYASLPHSDPESAPWNLLVMRNLLRGQRYRLTNSPMPSVTNCLLCYTEAIAGMRALPAERSWSLMPQLVGRSATDRQTGRPDAHRRDLDPSLDFRMRVGAGTVVAATLNPDFSQIELDAPQLSGNTAFSLFTAEKRPFFLEGADILATPVRAVHTRTMTDPDWGVRLTRRNDDMDLVALSVRDAGGGLVQLPGAYGTRYAAQDFASQATVVRANLRGADATLGAVFTDRTLEHGRGYNRVLGPDAMWQRGDAVRLRGQLLFSETTALPDAAGRLVRGEARRGHAGFASAVAQNAGWYGNVAVEEVSRDFRADNGYVAQAGYSDTEFEVRRKFGRIGPMHAFNVYIFGESKREDDGDTLYKGAGLGAWMLGPYDSAFNVQLRPGQRVRTRDGGPLYERSDLWMRAEASPGPRWARAVAELTLGDAIDIAGERVGDGATLFLYSRLRLSDRLELEPLLNASRIDHAADGARLYTEQALSLTGIYHLSARDSVRGTWQRSVTRRDPARYPRPVEPLSRRMVGSVIYAHERAFGTALYAGVTRSDETRPASRYAQRQTEVFVKGSWLL